ncbi:hypothetical protein BU24DRAFT_359001 [Aaosphaeria arxii CBS 175.79]|uniref:BZIP domain-containing protein n=1 Tax=Aaosphaeria arxii CBS 175.79 TaxID=1450172 RepID=A0A6A5X8D2_9PLEO|nr:uncharacterized protein BU24DRAFT_359001 [Aaosphaeria arxii CBS 175.79]KAF2009160.1 hypothetical protein BU24DRAFT_359001 [Aaosphaeria arxii CBS 175.79]
MTAPVGKAEPSRDGSTSSIASSPEPETQGTYTQENPQQQKRKGGRKPIALTKRRKIYATSEERKQRNRQAQAAFRERRTEYIKQLESTIKHHEETLQNLQNSHRNAADECLMLRYKNSLLERILLEKGIDVQAELRAKTGSPNLGPTRAAASAQTSPNQPPLQQRAILNRQQQRRSLGGPPKAEGVHHGLPMIQPDGALPQRSPLSQPTPASHLSSPTASQTQSPNFMPQGTSVSPNFGPLPQQQPGQQPLRPQPPRSHFTPIMGPQGQQGQQGPQRPSVITNQSPSNGINSASTVGSGPASVMTQSSTSGGPSSYYTSPFESHMNQLGNTEQEYDEQADMLDHDDPSDQSAGPGPGPFSQQNFPQQGQSMQQNQGMQPPMQPAQNQQYTPPSGNISNNDSNGVNAAVFNGMNHLFDPYDPMLDADPFGLSASMHFPTMYESR